MPVYTLSARLKYGSFDHNAESDIIVPQAMIDCKALWDKRGKRRSWPKDQWKFVRATLEPMLYGSIDPEDVHYNGGLINTRGTIYSKSVELLSVSFENGPVPDISAYAYFDLQFRQQFADEDAFGDWMENTDSLEWATNFGWRFPSGDEYNAADLTGDIEVQILLP